MSADGNVVVVGDGQTVEVRRPGDPTAPTVAVSLPPLDATAQIPWWDLSADGSRLLGGVLNRSNETQDLFVFDNATGQQLLVGTEYFAVGFPRLNSSGKPVGVPDAFERPSARRRYQYHSP